MNQLNLESSGKFYIKGPQKASGEIYISGSKNSVLPIMAASILTDEKVIIRNVPKLADVSTMIEILKSSGKTVSEGKNTITINSNGFLNSEIPYEPVRKMRASFNVYGPLLVKNKTAKVALPGGCSLGARPVNYHLQGLSKLGLKSEIEHGYVIGHLDEKKQEVHISLPFPSVGATEHIITTASLLKGTKTYVSNCALEPEIADLIEFLKQMGVKIKGENTSSIVIEGVETLHGVDYTVIPDRIETGTYAILGALIGDNLKIRNINENHIQSLLSLFEDIGVNYKIDRSENSLIVNSHNFHNLKNTDIETSPYPGFATDLQPQISVLLSLVKGKSTITENIFKSRFNHIDELNRMGAQIAVEDTTAVIKGVEKLSGAPVEAANLRDSAALINAALIAEGESIISNIDHVFRGYENIQEKLKSINLNINYNV